MNQRKSKLKDNKGITLIALVITIIVLLILAGVTIAALSGNDSAPKKAVEAKIENDRGAAKDAATLIVTEKIQDYYEAKYISNGTNAGTILAYLESELSSAKAVTRDGYKVVVANGKITVTKGEETMATGTVSSAGVITWDGTPTGENGNSGGGETPSTWTGSVTSAEQTALEANGMGLVADADVPSNMKTNSVKAVLTGNVPIPTGYTYKEGTSTTESTTPTSWGVVIEDENHNEWVWVPANASDMYDPISATQIGAKKETNIPKIAYAGKLEGVKLASIEELDGIKIASQSASGSEETEEERAAREADEQAAKTTTVEKKSKSGIITGVTRGVPSDTYTYREPALVTNYDLQEQYYTQAGFNSAVEMAQAFVDDYNAMIASVGKYGGFYVGRYELSGSVEGPTVKVNQNVLMENWYSSYKAERNVGANNNVQSTMMWGCQWDIMCKWTQESGDQVSYSEVHTDRHTGSLAQTGANSNDRSNNIMDIEGNCFEYTQEANGVGNRAWRGGNCYDYFSRYTAGYRSNSIPYNGGDSSRPSLYIK